MNFRDPCPAGKNLKFQVISGGNGNSSGNSRFLRYQWVELFTFPFTDIHTTIPGDPASYILHQQRSLNKKTRKSINQPINQSISGDPAQPWPSSTNTHKSINQLVHIYLRSTKWDGLSRQVDATARKYKMGWTKQTKRCNSKKVQNGMD